MKGGNDSLSKTRRESMFIQILEGLLHPTEAELLCLIKDKQLTKKFKITKANVDAFPDIRWGDRS